MSVPPSPQRLQNPGSPSLWIGLLLLALGGLPASAAAPRPAAGAKPPPFRRILPHLSASPGDAPLGAGRIEFIGARAFSADQLRTALTEQIREITERGLTRPRADDTAYYLAVYYRKQGFPDVEVAYEIRGNTLV